MSGMFFLPLRDGYHPPDPYDTPHGGGLQKTFDQLLEDRKIELNLSGRLILPNLRMEVTVFS